MYGKPVTGCQTYHRKGMALHCSRAEEIPPSDHGQRNAVHSCLHIVHKKKANGKAHAGRRVPSRISTTTPRTRFCMRCAEGMKAKPPTYAGMCGQSWHIHQ